MAMPMLTITFICCKGRRREEVEETLRGSTEAILRVAPRARRTRDDQEKEKRRGVVGDTQVERYIGEKLSIILI